MSRKLSPLSYAPLYTYSIECDTSRSTPMATCDVCGKTLTGRQTRFCSVECKNSFHQRYPAQRLRGVRRKLELVKMLGGKCSKCGYDKNLSALSFHHIADKTYKMETRNISNRSRERVLAEFAKCQLLCLNCHAELHNPHMELSQLEIAVNSNTTRSG